MSNTWATLPCINISSLIGCKSNIIGCHVFISGGIEEENMSKDSKNYCSSFRIIDLSKNTTKEICPPQSIGFYGHATCITPKNNILISGGIYTPQNRIFLFNLKSNEFTIIYTKGDIMENKSFHTINFLPKPKLYLLYGGRNMNDSISNDLIIINPDTFECINEKWDGDWPHEVCNHTSSVIGRKLYVFGGQTKYGPTNELWCLNYVNKKWEKLDPSGNIPKERYNHCAIVLRNLIFICGGYNDFGCLSDCYIYHTHKNTWYSVPSYLNIPFLSPHLSIAVSNSKLCLLSPSGNWYINPKNIINSVFENGESHNVLVPTNKIDTLYQKMNDVTLLLEKTTEKYSQIGELLELERLCLEMQQTISECKKLPIHKQVKPPSVNQITKPEKIPNTPPVSNKRGRGNGRARGRSRRSSSATEANIKHMLSLGNNISPINKPNNNPNNNPNNKNINNKMKNNTPLPGNVSRKPNRGRMVKPYNTTQSRPAKERQTVIGVGTFQQPALVSKIRSESALVQPQSNNTHLQLNKNLLPNIPPGKSPNPPPRKRNNAANNRNKHNESPSKPNTSTGFGVPTKALPRPPSNERPPKSTVSKRSSTPSQIIEENNLDDNNSEIDPKETYFKEGSVWKRKITKKVISKWKFRYFKLCQNVIYYYINEYDSSPKGQLDMASTKVRRIRPRDDDVHIKDNHLWCMEFTTLEATYHIAVDTETELSEWLQILKKVERKYYNATKIRARKPKQGLFHTLKKKSAASFDLSSPSDTPIFTRQDTNTPIESTVDSNCTPREAIIKEIISTERDYVSDLLIITDFYIKRLQDFKILKKDFKDVIFANVEDLVPIHQEFLEKLEKENENDDPQFSKIFIDQVPKWTPYVNFCASQSNSKEEIANYCEKNHNFAMCLEELKNQPECRKLDLASYLIKPMQRLCKYPLLLKELKKETPEDHIEYNIISEATTVVSNILAKVNDNKREADNVVELLQLQESFSDLNINIHTKGQRIVKKTVFKKVQYDSTKEPSKHTVWLLNDVLLVGKQTSKNKYSLRVSMPVETMIVWDLDDSKTTTTEHKHSLSIFRTDKRNIKIVITANSSEEKIQWITLLNERIADVGFVGI